MIESVNEAFEAFKISAECINAEKHGHFAFFDIVLSPGTRISEIQKYSDELAIALKTHSSFTLKPLPSKGIIRLQTTYGVAEKILFDSLYSASLPPKSMYFPFLFGKTSEGKPLWVDMAKNPHMLISGCTGSGKSVMLHTLIANAAKQNRTRLYLIDTKHVEFAQYNHDDIDWLVVDVANRYERALSILHQLDAIMERRYTILAEKGLNSVESNPNLFYKILLIIDEVADLMLFDTNKEFEKMAAKLAQKARAAGIYMVFATQRPSIDVLTGTLKANFPARLSCKVTSKNDSQVILDKIGAEDLVGNGDAIFNNSMNPMVRFQAAYSTPQTIMGN